jgi:hypothetical protein
MSKLVKIDNKLSVSDNKLAKFVAPVYHVNLMPTEHGSYSAFPTSGYTGTDVTLYNTPDSEYEFDGFRIEGSELWTPNSFDLYRSDVNVYGTFSRKPIILCNLGDTQYGANITFDLTGVPDSITDRYVMYKTDLANFTGVNDVNFVSSAGSWRMRNYQGGRVGFVGITGIVSAWTTAEGVTGISSFTADSVSYRHWSGFDQTNDWRTVKIIIDQEELKAHTFLKGTYIGYATVKSGIVTAPIKQIQLQVEVNIRPQAKNVRVVSSDYYEKLVNWTDA